MSASLGACCVWTLSPYRAVVINASHFWGRAHSNKLYVPRHNGLRKFPPAHSSAGGAVHNYGPRLPLFEEGFKSQGPLRLAFPGPEAAGWVRAIYCRAQAYLQSDLACELFEFVRSGHSGFLTASVLNPYESYL